MRAARLVLAGLALLLGLGGLAMAQTPEQRSVVVRVNTSLSGLDGQPSETVPALTILACLSCQEPDGQRLRVVSPTGREALLPAESGLLLQENPDQAMARLKRLKAVELDVGSTLRALAGRIAVDDSTWVVETAWGPSQRRFMVNYFMDEEHLVYLPQGSPPLLLRFKGGRLIAPLPAESLPGPVERAAPPR